MARSRRSPVPEPELRSGDKVTYHDESGQSHPALVVGVVGSGKSGYKVLDISYVFAGSGLGSADAVPYLTDKEYGKGYWSFGEPAKPVVAPEALARRKMDWKK